MLVVGGRPSGDAGDSQSRPAVTKQHVRTDPVALSKLDTLHMRPGESSSTWLYFKGQ